MAKKATPSMAVEDGIPPTPRRGKKHLCNGVRLTIRDAKGPPIQNGTQSHYMSGRPPTEGLAGSVIVSRSQFSVALPNLFKSPDFEGEAP